ncbi:hypothetical protein CJ030_MR3G011066 [Morella rubra]|uniref:Uncharacterized protein n=1 Tax=Morella rubra TaxID=262757 RepID=A0A6A1W6D5_9ROSI|nr:hypothetical protein CJ030_MR3G011073 [Morella rubra]KAB1219674.1 hypothetical protein CJ030_MR3G011066 [Morella rubra]
MTTSMKTGFDNIKKLPTDHTKCFGTFDKDMSGLKHQVNNSIHVTSNVIQHTVDEFASTSVELQAFVKSSAKDVVKAIEVHLEENRNLRSHVMNGRIGSP